MALNNKVEQDHRLIRFMLGLNLLRTVPYILCGTESMHILKKKQIHQRGDVCSKSKRIHPIHKLFGVAS
ncbi:hypothetical protein [Priestia megaterium]|uniref:hypothetical protein n=1 Tax=Priestia megaterium TaxID=1404 RepID=UPI000AFE28F5